jgi:transposase
MDNRLFIDAVLYRYRAGIPWRDLPERFGDFRVVHTRFSRWAARGVWEKVFRHLAKDADNEYARGKEPECRLFAVTLSHFFSIRGFS